MIWVPHGVDGLVQDCGISVCLQWKYCSFALIGSFEKKMYINQQGNHFSKTTRNEESPHFLHL